MGSIGHEEQHAVQNVCVIGAGPSGIAAAKYYSIDMKTFTASVIDCLPGIFSLRKPSPTLLFLNKEPPSEGFGTTHNLTRIVKRAPPYPRRARSSDKASPYGGAMKLLFGPPFTIA
jgi:hypothetical protein